MKYIIFLSLVIISYTGCTSNEIFVYETIPENTECQRFKEYKKIKSCNLKHQIILNKNLSKVIDTTNYRLDKIYNQGERCKEFKYRHAPDGCYINHLPSRKNIPTFGRTYD